MSDAGTFETVTPVNEWLLEAASRVHGRGLFARRAIEAGTRLVEYVGLRITKAEALQHIEAENPYIFCLDETWDLDGSVEWNPARFINHSCEPNCEAEEEDGHIWIVALRSIAGGEEISFNYGYDLEDFREHPCRCGAAGCVGFMVAAELFPVVRAKLDADAAAV